MVNKARFLELFSRRLRVTMERAKYTSGYVSNYCKFGRRAMSDYVNGARLPNPWYLVLIAECLDCRVDELLGFRGPAAIMSTDASSTFGDEKEFAVFVRDRMVERMEAKNMTAEDLANRIGMDLQNVNGWFSMWPALPRTFNLIDVAKALGCTPSDLLGY